MESSPSSPSKTNLSFANIIHYDHLALSNRQGTNLQFRPKVLIEKPLNIFQTTLLDNLWCNKSDTKAMIHTLNCLTICFNGINRQVEFLNNEINKLRAEANFSNISLFPKTPTNLQKVVIANQEAKIQELEKSLELEKEKYKQLENENKEIEKDQNYLSNIILDISEDNLLKQHQYMYLPEMDDNIKRAIFFKIKNSNQKDMEEAYKEIVLSYLSNEEVSGISYASKTLVTSALENRHCLCKICMPGFYMIHISINMILIKKFQKWTIKKLMEYGLLSKLIISRDDKLSDQIECLEHTELKRIIYQIFEDFRIYSISIIINSTGPAYEELLDGAKHIIEIHKTPESFKAEQYDDTPHLLIDPDLSNQSLKYYRALQIAQFGRFFETNILHAVSLSR